MAYAPTFKLNEEEQAKLADFFGTYPEKLVNDFVKRLVFGAYYPQELNAFFVHHLTTAAAPHLTFSSPKIEKARSDFVKALAELSAFLVQHFAVPDPSRKSFYLLPKINQKWCEHQQTPEEYAEWNKYKRTLDALIEKVEIPYRELVFVAKLPKPIKPAS